MQRPRALSNPNPKIKKLYPKKFIIISGKKLYPNNFLNFGMKSFVCAFHPRVRNVPFLVYFYLNVSILSLVLYIRARS